MILHTPNLTLIPATAALAHAEIHDRESFAASLHAEVPGNWPPETVADALPWFLTQLTDNPALSGWLTWYAIFMGGVCPVLAASIGFFGPPHLGEVEIGYSVLPQFQGRGCATEMVICLAAWALSQPDVKSVVAETSCVNFSSQRVLEKAGFNPAGPGQNADYLKFACLHAL